MTSGRHSAHRTTWKRQGVNLQGLTLPGDAPSDLIAMHFCQEQNPCNEKRTKET